MKMVYARKDSPFNVDEDIPDQSGKVVIVTGGNAGLGAECVRQLAIHGAHVFLAARSEEKASKTIDNIVSVTPSVRISFLRLDLSSFSSVKQCAESFLRSSARLDTLMNNAGIMACPAGLTEDGYEIQLGTNHMGHALLVKFLLPCLLSTAKSVGDARIITLSSGAIKQTFEEGLRLSECSTDMPSCSPIKKYGQSKIANLLYSTELARNNPALTCVAINPGFVGTGITQGPNNSWPLLRPFFDLASLLLSVSVEEGAKNQLWAATVEKLKIKSGLFYDPVGRVADKGRHGTNEGLGKALWDWTQREFVNKGF